MRRLDITGERFGMLVAKAHEGDRRGQAMWRCVCDCGANCLKQLGNLRSGHTTSCGCKRATETATRKTRHGLYGTPTYKSWQSMLVRCTNKENHKYASYGGRGIQVCERWKSFENFLADMGARPRGSTLGRIDNDGNYDPANCEWQSAIAQGRNKRNTRTYCLDGIQGTLREHCERLGLKQATVRSRIYLYHWPIEKAFSN